MCNVKFYEDEDMHCRVEKLLDPNINDEKVFVHVTFNSFNKSVLARSKKVWGALKERLFLEGFDEVYTYTTRPKMSSLYKGGDVLGVTKEGLTVIKWDLA